MMASKRTTDIEAYNAMKAKLFGNDELTDEEYYYQEEADNAVNAPSEKAEKRSNYTVNAKDIKPRSKQQATIPSFQSLKNHPNAPPTVREYHQRKREIFSEGKGAYNHNNQRKQQNYHRHKTRGGQTNNINHKRRGGGYTNNGLQHPQSDTASYFQPHSKPRQKTVQHVQKQSKKYPKYRKVEKKSNVSNAKNQKVESKYYRKKVEKKSEVAKTEKAKSKMESKPKKEVGKVYPHFNNKLGKKSYYIKKGEKPMIKGTFTPEDIDEKLSPKSSPKSKSKKSVKSRARGKDDGRGRGRGRGRGVGKRYTLADSKFLAMLASKEMNPFLTEKAQKASDEVLDYMDDFNKNEALNDWWELSEVKAESENEKEKEKELEIEQKEAEIANGEAADSENECEQNMNGSPATAQKHEITHYLASMKAHKLMNQYNVPPPVKVVEAKKPEIDSHAMKQAAEMIQRNEWKVGDKVNIFSISKQCWCNGKIIKISLNQSVKEWKIGSNCNIFSKSQQKWFQGNVTKVFMENDEQHLEVEYNGYTKQVNGRDREVIKFVEVDESKGEWLTVIYENQSKVISRYHQNIRPVEIEQNGVQEKALEYLAEHMADKHVQPPLMMSSNGVQNPMLSPMGYDPAKQATVPSPNRIKYPREYDQTQQANIDQMMAYNQQLYNLSLQSMQANNGNMANAFPLSPPPQNDYFNYNGGNNVYVKGLSPKVDDAELMQMFNKFGKIISAKIKYDKYGKSRCFGFVLFESSKNAMSAISAMANVMHRGKMLYVTQYQSKEFRKSFLKNQMSQMQSSTNGMDASASICWDFNSMRGCSKDKKCKWKHEYFDGKTFHPISGELLDGNAARQYRETIQTKIDTAK